MEMANANKMLMREYDGDDVPEEEEEGMVWVRLVDEDVFGG